ncbi:serine O-acetyltransferase EpsC [uncultured Hyphomicrobium sp.]|uniref:serine O-acetyltransferase EpsC n=1 Tax=uncultured Hyphomicrobium sp. TaxID=194373 RepID=UPI0025E754FC|nr:serine O-acetyltransferase EpsC [uncultured Hyphomicrobium sp.]
MSFNIDRVVTSLRNARSVLPRTVDKTGRVLPLPSPRAVSEAISDLTSSLFPRRFGGARANSNEALDYFVGHTLGRALDVLQGQVIRELAFTASLSSEGLVDADQTSRVIVQEFADSLPAILEVLYTDVRAAYDGDPSAKSQDEVLLSFPGVRAIIYHRLAHALYKLDLPIIARIIAESSHSQTGIDIHPGAEIGGSFFIDHGTGVVIGETAIIGERVRLYQAVTLGAKRFSVDENGALVKGQPRHPIVEDDVVVYAGATILGRVTIGRGSVIGGNVWLTRSVPPGSNIVQAQARSDVFDSGAGI